MKAWVLNDIGNIELKDIKKPEIANDEEAIVHVKAAGICGSDIPRIFDNGAHKMPLVLGHEFAGELEDGTHVGIFPLIPCKKCRPCQMGKYEMCRNYNYLGSRCDGGFAEYVSVPKWNLIKLPNSVSFEQAAMLEPMAVSVHAIRRINPDSNDSVLVYGMGTIGLLITMFLIEKGIKNVFVVGNKDFQKKQAIELGIKEENYCDSRESCVKEWIMEKTDGFGVSSVFECIGRIETISEVIDMASPGGSVCLVGNPYSDVELPKNVYWKILRHQLNVTGTWNSSFAGTNENVMSCASDCEANVEVNNSSNKFAELDDWQYVIDKLANGLIHPEKLITHKLDMDNLYSGFEIMHEKKENYIKIMMIN